MHQRRNRTPTRGPRPVRGSPGAPVAAGVMAMLLALAGNSTSAAPELRYAWIDRGTSEAEGAFSVRRKGEKVVYSDAGLQRCDEIEWTDVTRPVLVRLSDGRRFLFSKSSGKRVFTVPCDQQGIDAELMALIGSFVGAVDRKTVRSAAALASRDAMPLADSKPTSLSAPLLDAERPQLVAGTRALYIRWIGGTGPFEVTLADKASGAVLARRSGLTVREVTLPAVQLPPGNYQLQIRQPKGLTGHILSEDGLTAVDAARLPPPPPALGTLRSEAQELFYADFLAGCEEGRWKFEAAQRVATLAPQSSAAREWLKHSAGDFSATSAP